MESYDLAKKVFWGTRDKNSQGKPARSGALVKFNLIRNCVFSFLVFSRHRSRTSLTESLKTTLNSNCPKAPAFIKEGAWVLITERPSVFVLEIGTRCLSFVS